MKHSSLFGAAVAASFLAVVPSRAATTIDVSNTVVVPAVKRMGINLGDNAYWDRQIVKNLIFDNPGFEGLLYRSVVQCASGTATGCTDNLTSSAWPSGFWNGAAYEFIWGAAKGRAGTVVSSFAPSSGSGGSYVFADSGVAPAAGDFVVLRKMMPGSADFGWFRETTNGGAITTELADLPPGTEGKQAIRLTAPNGGVASITATLDNLPSLTFLQLNGMFRLTFKAKGASTGDSLHVTFTRRRASATTTFVDQSLPLPPLWSTYTFDFAAAENGTSIGPIELQFSPGSPSAVLLDDVSLTQTNGDPANTTVFRDPVVSALRSYRPGLLRYLYGQIGDSLDNQIAPPFARARTGYSSNAVTNVTGLEYGLHEFLELCDLIGAEPWYVFSVSYSNQEMANLIEYLGGPASSPYGAKRAARGRVAPWTDAFSRIHLEFGNEAWNDGDFSGASISDPTAYGSRGGELYGIVRSSPYYMASKYDLVLGGQSDNLPQNTGIVAASRNNDTFAVGPYLAIAELNDFANDEQLFGPLFAEPEMVETTGYMRDNYNMVRSSGRPVPLSVYEVNIDATQGSISQAALDSFAPSIGVGIAVADHMLMMLRDLGMRDQMLFSLTQYSARRGNGRDVKVWGVTRDLGVTDRKRPQFLSLKLANEVLSGDLVRTTRSGDDPTWNQPLLNGISYPNAHYIQSFAFSDGPRRSVIVFNLSRTSPLDVNFTGLNAPSGTVTLKRLTAAAITDNNEDRESVVTTTQTLNNFNAAAPLRLPPFSMSVLQWRPRGQGHRRAVN